MGNKQRNHKNVKKKKGKKKIWKKVMLVISLVLLVAIGVFAYRVHLNGGGMSGMLAAVVGHDENTKKKFRRIPSSYIRY